MIFLLERRLLLFVIAVWTYPQIKLYDMIRLLSQIRGDTRSDFFKLIVSLGLRPVFKLHYSFCDVVFFLQQFTMDVSINNIYIFFVFRGRII